MKILIVEDEQALADILHDEFVRAGSEVQMAYDGQEAIDVLKTSVPDVILLDLLLPKKDGFEVLGEMQKDERLKAVPVVILSNLAQDEDVKRGLSLGAKDYFVKTRLSLKEVVEKATKYANKQ
ncbi:response regulator [Candidatus Uhrbacteria bacterium]|nr:response regulator [Candidatus Uhrbacteria bacterium]